MPYDLNPYADFLDLVHGDNDPTLQLERFLCTEVKNPVADPWQTEVLESTASTIAICVARQVGKSCVLAAKAIRALERGHTVLATAPAERQVKLLTRKVAQYLRTTNLVIERSTLTEIETSNGGHWVAVPSTSDTIRGFTIHCAIADEASFLGGGGEEVISAITPMLVEGGQLLLASTPAGKEGLFAQHFLDPKPHVHRVLVKGTQIPRLKAKVDRLRQELSTTRFQQEVECRFLSSGRGYFDMSIIEQATSTKVKAICPTF